MQEEGTKGKGIEEVSKRRSRKAKLEPLRSERKEHRGALSERENELMLALSLVDDLVFILDENGIFIGCNQPSGKPESHVPPGEFSGKSFKQVLPTSVSEQFDSAIKTLLAENTVQEFDYCLEGKGGGKWYRAKLSRRISNVGKFAGVIAICRDITERKRAEDSLRFTQFAVDQVSDAAFWILPDARFIYVNDAACRLMGYSRDKLLTMSACDITSAFSQQSWPDYWKQLKQRGSFSFESDCRTKDGRILPVEITGNFMEFGGNRYNCAFIRDITERKKAEVTLQREHDLLRLMMDNLPDKIYVKDTESRFVLGNKAVVEYEAMESEEELIGKTDFDLRPKELADGFYALEQEIIKTGQPLVNLEELVIDKQGNERLVLITKVPMRDENGRIIGLVGINRDITEFKRAEQALRDSEERYKRLSELTLEGIAIHDNGILIDVNPAFAGMFGYEVDKLKGKDLLKIIPAGEFVDIVREKNAAGYTNLYEILARRKNGTVFPIEIEAREIILEGRKMRVAAVRDITERKRAEKKLLDYQAQLKSLASQLTLAEEHERRRIAMELHDQISQSLAVSKIKLDALRVTESSTVILDVLNEVSDSLMQVIHDTRSLTFDLSFPILYELGFEAAVAAWLADQIEDKHCIETEFEEDVQPKPLDDDVRILLFRNVRELLINVVKHAHAKKVKVSVSRVGKRMCVSVQDDGVGFEPAEVTQRTAKGAEFGLFSIRERLEQLGGQLKIESVPDCGCKVTITAPLKVE